MRLVKDCLRITSQLGDFNNRTLCWVPGFAGIIGNKCADALVNRASAVNFIGPELFCVIPKKLAMQVISIWA